MYVFPDIEQVPVDRVIKNLETQANASPTDAAGWRTLARAHALAFAQKTATLPVVRGRENLGPWFGPEPKNVPFQLKAGGDDAARRAANEHLKKAIEHYRRALQLDGTHLVTRLGYAWTLEQSGAVTQAIAEYRAIIEEA